jgi:hypothetical protein
MASLALCLLFLASGFALPSSSLNSPAAPHGGAAAPVSVAPVPSSLPALPRAQATITFYTTPSNCGAITFNGSNWVDLQAGAFPAGTYAVSATPCGSWYLVGLKGGGSVSITGNTATVTGSANGSVSAVFAGYSYTILFATVPPNCGTVDFNGTPYLDLASTTSSPGSFPVGATPCGGFYTASIKGSGGVAVVGSTATVTGNGTITATFEPKTLNLTVFSDPPGCGGVLVGTKGIASGTTGSVLAGTYQYETWACVGYVLQGILGSTNVTVSPWVTGPKNGTLDIFGNGNVTLLFGLEIFNITFLTRVIGEPNENGGTITFQNQTFTNGTVAQFPAFTQGVVGVTPYPNYMPTGFPINVTGGVHWEAYLYSIFINGSGDVIAYFLPVHYYVEFTTNQEACTATTIKFNDSVFGLIDYYGARVLVGTYLVSAPFCTGFSFAGYSALDPAVVGVSQWSGIVWVNGSGTISVNFVPNWILVSGSVDNYVTRQPVAEASVFIFYAGQVVNESAATGRSGNWSMRLSYGGYSINATAPLYTTSPTQTFFVNGTPAGISGFIVWVNATLGLPTTPGGLVGFVSTYPGILVPVAIILIAVALIIVVQMSFKWTKIEEEERRQRRAAMRARRPPPLLPGGPYPGPAGQLPPPGMAPMRPAQLPPGAMPPPAR